MIRYRPATISLVLAAIVIAGVGGCSVFLPRKDNSQIAKSEKLLLEMWDTRTYELNKARYGLPDAPDLAEFVELPQPEVGPIAGAAAAMAVGMAVDYVRKELEEEKDLYIAQYGLKVAKENFWTTQQQTLTQNYVAIHLVRTAEEFGSDKPALEMIALIQPSADRRVFSVTPVYFKMAAAKAKVLDRNPVAFWTLLMAEEEVDVKLQVEIDAIWIDEEQEVHLDKVGDFGFSVTGYNLNTTPILRQPELASYSFGWFPGIPRSASFDGKSITGTGTFWLAATVTESDTSQARKYIEKAATAVGSRKEDIVKLVVAKDTK